MFILAIGSAFLISNSIILFFTFISAYLNNYVITININKFGEAHIEFIFIPFSICIGIYSLYILFRNLKVEKGYKTKNV